MEKNVDVINKKRNIINFISTMISFAIQLAISFFITPILINSLGKSQYSFYPIANNIVSYMTIITSALNTMASRYITISIAKKDIDNAQKYFSSIFCVNIIISGIMIIPSVILVFYLDYILNIPINVVGAIKILFAFVFSSAIINVFSSVFGIATFAVNRIDLRAIRESITNLVKLLLFILFFVLLQSSIIYVGIIILSIAVMNFIIQFFYSKYLLPNMKATIKFASFSYTKELLVSSLWNILVSMGSLLIAGLSLVLCNIYYGDLAAGTYSIVQTVPNLMNTLISQLYSVFFPMLTYKFAMQNDESVLKEVLSKQKIVAIISFSIIICFGVLSDNFFQLWVPNEYSSELEILTWIILIEYLFVGMFFNLYHLTIAMNRIKFPAIMELIFGLASIIISFFSWKLGAPYICMPIIATIFTSLWIGILFPLYVSKLYGKNIFFFYKNFIKCNFIGVVLFIIFYNIKEQLIINNWLMFFMLGGLFGITSLITYTLLIIGPKNIIINLNKN